MTVKVFFYTPFKELLSEQGIEPSTLKNDFQKYKETGTPPNNFGRDAEYNHPRSLHIVRVEKLSHIHLEEPDTPWNPNTYQFHRTSDSHLIYCPGFYNESHYLLIAILAPNAHEQARNNSIMYKLGEIAEKFREKH